ncbi:B2L15 protein, partial [Phaetusa simplex]|nr:B2L15 protein [Phaetusa simplex]
AAMATFEKQTECVVNALYSDLLGDDESDCRNLETDSEGRASQGRKNDDWKTFNPGVIASRLRKMGDRCNMDFERVSSKDLAEVLKGEKLKLPSRCLQMEKFGAAVDSLSRSWSDRNPELVYERAFLCVSAKLLMYLLKKVPAMVHPSYIISAINGNSQVRNYIEAHGGWVRMRR